MNNVVIHNSPEVLTIDDVDKMTGAIVEVRTKADPSITEIFIVASDRHLVSLITGKAYGNSSDWLRNYVTFHIVTEPVTITPPKK